MRGDGEEAAGLETERLSLTRVWRDRPTSLNGLSVQTPTACRTGGASAPPSSFMSFYREGEVGGAGCKFDAMNKNAITYTSPSALRLYKWALKSISQWACKAVCRLRPETKKIKSREQILFTEVHKSQLSLRKHCPTPEPLQESLY